jgi:hypothetical protein
MAMLNNLGIPGSGVGILHPKHKNKFQVIFVGIGGIGTNITRQVTTVTRPQIEFEEINLHRYNSIAYVAGKQSWSACSLTLEDDMTGLASSAIQTQLEKQQRIIGADGANGQWLNSAPTASGYKFGTRIELLDGNETVTESWMLEGCFLQAVEYGDLDYSASEAVTINLTIRFDTARQQLNPSATGSVGIAATYGSISNATSSATMG